jgi:hypothetical protein
MQTIAPIPTQSSRIPKTFSSTSSLALAYGTRGAHIPRLRPISTNVARVAARFLTSSLPAKRSIVIASSLFDRSMTARGDGRKYLATFRRIHGSDQPTRAAQGALSGVILPSAYPSAQLHIPQNTHASIRHASNLNRCGNGSSSRNQLPADSRLLDRQTVRPQLAM